MERRAKILMHKYEVGRLLGQGNFAKVYHARNLESNESVAIKVIDKDKVMQVGLIDQIKREISVMRRVRHPNVVQLYEVMASKSKIYFAMEYAKGGELFNKIVRGRLKEDATRKYFQQLIAAVDFCHSRGVYHRDLKPENLLLDENGNLKVTDFGLSALLDSRRQDGLLHTTCGTPAYIAPEVINRKGYDGAKADIWSCGVILFVLLAGYLPFSDGNLLEMYKKISKGTFKCPQWFPNEVKKLVSRILHPDRDRRITVSMIMENCWFRKGFQQIKFPEPQEDGDRVSLNDVNAAFSTSDSGSKTAIQRKPMKPTSLNAFHIISSSQSCDLSGMFEKELGEQLDTRFTTTKPPSTIVSKLEEIAKTQSFEVQMKDSKVNLKGSKLGRKGHLAVDAEIFEVTPSLHVVEVKKTAGDTLEYQTLWDNGLRPSLQDILWT